MRSSLDLFQIEVIRASYELVLGLIHSFSKQSPIVHLTALSSSSDILYSLGHGGYSTGSIKSILRSIVREIGLPGFSNTSAYLVSSSSYLDANAGLCD